MHIFLRERHYHIVHLHFEENVGEMLHRIPVLRQRSLMVARGLSVIIAIICDCSGVISGSCCCVPSAGFAFQPMSSMRSSASRIIEASRRAIKALQPRLYWSEARPVRPSPRGCMLGYTCCRHCPALEVALNHHRHICQSATILLRARKLPRCMAAELGYSVAKKPPSPTMRRASLRWSAG